MRGRPNLSLILWRSCVFLGDLEAVVGAKDERRLRFAHAPGTLPEGTFRPLHPLAMAGGCDDVSQTRRHGAILWAGGPRTKALRRPFKDLRKGFDETLDSHFVYPVR